MGKAKVVLMLLFVLALGAGVVAGMLVSRLPLAGASTQTPRTPLGEELGLSPEQSEKMRSIWEGIRGKVDQCFVSAQDVQKRRDEAMVGMLTEEQKAKFARVQQEYTDALATLKNDRDAAFQDAVKQTEQILTEPQKARYREILQSRGLGRGSTAARDWISPHAMTTAPTSLPHRETDDPTR